MTGVDSEIRMTLKDLSEKGCSKAEMARLLGLPESNVRYHLKCMAEGAIDGRELRPRCTPGRVKRQQFLRDKATDRFAGRPAG